MYTMKWETSVSWNNSASFGPMPMSYRNQNK